MLYQYYWSLFDWINFTVERGWGFNDVLCPVAHCASRKLGQFIIITIQRSLLVAPSVPATTENAQPVGVAWPVAGRLVGVGSAAGAHLEGRVRVPSTVSGEAGVAAGAGASSYSRGRRPVAAPRHVTVQHKHTLHFATKCASTSAGWETAGRTKPAQGPGRRVRRRPWPPPTARPPAPAHLLPAPAHPHHCSLADDGIWNWWNGVQASDTARRKSLPLDHDSDLFFLLSDSGNLARACHVEKLLTVFHNRFWSSFCLSARPFGVEMTSVWWRDRVALRNKSATKVTVYASENKY